MKSGVDGVCTKRVIELGRVAPIKTEVHPCTHCGSLDVGRGVKGMCVECAIELGRVEILDENGEYLPWLQAEIRAWHAQQAYEDDLVQIECPCTFGDDETMFLDDKDSDSADDDRD